MKTILTSMLLGASLLFAGCQGISWDFLKAKKDLAETKAEIASTMGVIEERERQMATAIKETLENIEVDQRPALENPVRGRIIIAHELAEEQERVLGIPIEKIDEEQLYQDWLLQIEEYENTIAILKDDNTKLLKDKYNLEIREEALQEQVTIYEEHQKSGGLWGWIKGFGLTGIIILIILCATAPTIGIPLVGRIVGWILKKVPQLIGAIGVVGKDVMDNIVEGIDGARKDFEINKDKTYTGAEVKAILDTYLSEGQDKDFYNVINARKNVIHKNKTGKPYNFGGINPSDHLK